MESVQCAPDVVPSPREDAEKIRNVVQGFGTHEKALISVIWHRNTAQRQLIKQAYQELYNEDLIKRLESELTGDFEKVVYRWMHDPVDRDAILAHAALKNLSQNYKILIALVSTHRYDGSEINASLASSEANILHDAIKEKAFNHEDVIRIFP
ncbi:Annexin-like protein rj4 [Thalictrum thalictroides]|uniref:Annexin-like protein rj4 n=1 Tax=Thalictrum thalictroides TaxID=46969 RepID=A0A7J6X479_THATH|nr:Annexin-like protein rj4 [Thalictrum thalictroides]